jgi:hypothetical protein
LGLAAGSLEVTDWRDAAYREVFEGTCRFLERGLRDETLSPDEIQRLLEAAYVDQGNDWLGRGALQEVTQAATIAAYEHVLAELAAAEERGGEPEGSEE